MSFLSDSGLAKLLTLLKGTSFPASDVFDWAKKRTKPTYTKDEVGLSEVDNTSDMDKPVSTAQQKAIDEAYKNSTVYTDTEIGKLVNGSPESLDTIYKLAEAMRENEDIIQILDDAISTKADKADLEEHISGETVHVTETQKERYEEAYSKKHEHENKDVLDSITYTMLDSIKNFASHIQDKIKHVTSEERELWNTIQTVDERFAKRLIYDDNHISLGRKEDTDIGENSVATGYDVEASGYFSHAEGTNTIANNYFTHAEGDGTTASGQGSHSEGGSTQSIGDYSHAEGNNTIASGRFSHSEGYKTESKGFCSHTEGCNTIATDENEGGSHAEGKSTTASETSHAEGYNTTATSMSHAEGYNTTATERSHSEGMNTTASGIASHAEGYNTTASGYHSHAEGDGTTASGTGAHSEGYNTEANYNYTHAEGYQTKANGLFSHVEGYQTIVSSFSQHAQGKYNVEDTEGTYAHIVGNGTSEENRSNAHTLDWEGNAWFAGNVTNAEGKMLSTNDLTDELIETWNNKSDFSGSYYDLTDTPTLPSIMTTENVGIGKPDGTTITVDEDGTIHSVGGSGSVDLSNYYNKEETEELLEEKANITDIPSSLPANGGSADTATKAEQDSEGNIITETYATKTELEELADIVGEANALLETI